MIEILQFLTEFRTASGVLFPIKKVCYNLIGYMIMAVDKRLIVNQIYSTSIQLFMDKGFDNISVNEICRNAGITKPTFYRYISSKDDILKNYYFDIPEFHPVINFENESQNDYIKLIIQTFRNSFSHYLSLGIDLLKSHIISQTGGLTMLAQANSEFRDTMIDYIEKGQKYGQILNDQDPEVILEQLMAVLLGYAFSICTDPTEDAVELEDLESLMVGICRARSDTPEEIHG